MDEFPMNETTKLPAQLAPIPTSTCGCERRKAAAQLVETLFDRITKSCKRETEFLDTCLDLVAELYLRVVSSNDVRFFESFLVSAIPFERALAAAYAYTLRSATRRMNAPKSMNAKIAGTQMFEPTVEAEVLSTVMAKEALGLLESGLCETDAAVLKQKTLGHTFIEIGRQYHRSTSWAAWRWQQIRKRANNSTWSADWKKSAAK